MSEPKRKASEAYLAKLRDPRWQKKRLEVFQRDNWTCGYCGDTKSSLQVHHKAYQKGKEPWDYPMDWLITACESCHEKQPRELTPEEMELIANLRSKGFGAYEIKLMADGFAHSKMRHKPELYAGAIYLNLVHDEVITAAFDTAQTLMAQGKKIKGSAV